MSKYLQGKRAYLSGPIQYGIDDDWRNQPRKILVEDYGIDLFDPFADPKQQWLPSLQKAREDQDIELIKKITKGFVRKDLCLVDRSDFLIAYLPDKVPTTGTHHEIINSNNSKKPTLLVTNMDNITHIPLWYFGFIDTKHMFAGWDSLFEYLNQVDQGNCRDDDRWKFVYGEI